LEQEQELVLSEIIAHTGSIDAVIFRMTAENVTIDWGDGSPAGEYSMLEDKTQLTHTYSSEKEWIITVRAEKLTTVNWHKNDLTALDVSKCPELTRLFCFDNNLTALDVSNGPAECVWQLNFAASDACPVHIYYRQISSLHIFDKQSPTRAGALPPR
jgi:hypothetical protein